MGLKLYDKIRLKNGKIAHIVEICEEGVAYMADVYEGDGEYETETIKQSDIAGIFVEIEKPLIS